MDRDRALALLRAHEAELRQVGIASICLFGSTARGEAIAESDIDVAVRLRPETKQVGFRYFGQIDTIRELIEDLFDRPVDIVVEPVRKERLRRAIERDAALAF